ncbi:ParA family protein [Salinirubrum litoreum]|uniref:ParA family protein n=1 Tax=Salinirubrum litoreum TaxID=1126234 RepID=A0ABD5REZ7_9EURY|nr:ParA family protein [Salinirubrum litoreum]
MADTTTAALVGATGGAGTTRLTLETAALLAREGEAVAVFDAAFATQGLGDALAGSLDPDLTGVLTEQATLAEAGVELPVAVAGGGSDPDAETDSDTEADRDGRDRGDRHVERDGRDGRVTCYPTSAPFTRLAEAKTAAAARRFETVLADAADGFDYVLCDTPPVAANQSVSAVNAVDRVGVVAPATTRGADAVASVDARLADVGVESDLVVANEGATPDPAPDAVDAGVTVPQSPTTALADAPSVATEEATLRPAVAALAGELLDADVTVSEDAESGRFDGLLSG